MKKILGNTFDSYMFVDKIIALLNFNILLISTCKNVLTKLKYISGNLVKINRFINKLRTMESIHKKNVL